MMRTSKQQLSAGILCLGAIAAVAVFTFNQEAAADDPVPQATSSPAIQSGEYPAVSPQASSSDCSFISDNDYKYYCRKSCSFIGNNDLKYYCRGDCSFISDNDLKYYCRKDCSFIGNNDLKYFCRGDCSFINDNDLKYFCRKQCSFIRNNNMKYLCRAKRKYPGKKPKR